MKSTLTLLLLCLCTGFARAQALDSLKFPLDADTHRITYAEVVPVEGASQAELYARAKLWFASTFKSAKDVVQAEDKEAGVLQGKGWQDIYIKSMGIPSASKLWYTVKLAVKDGRYRYEVTEFEIQSYPSKYVYNPTPTSAESILLKEKVSGMVKGIIRQERQQVDGAAHQLVTAIRSGMAKPAAGTSGGKSDW
ncbi:DUF4468 domain-containing protein [Hymenobacter sp. M29]|uniref:DUF4468 domain-containing protein n=1 Tax=Hymenobacter mellowenesis TaxID=3063995 RepID=A0ABT9AH42_9BACT|nr:DUF4468 domain-containing protein [Hymenobacter sp. M29]MDO7849195.1 DUF4468 domain-containing protein [Hymenobacter sp. M29]